MDNHVGLTEKEIDNNPFNQFDKWYKNHLDSGIAIADSVSLGTVSPDGRVSVRTVLLKNYDDHGFVFYTNYNSKKASQLSSNNKAALLFYWPDVGRQVRIEGVVDKVTDAESESYFKTRPRESQLSAWTSNQSSVVPNRKYLEDRYDFFKKRFLNKPVEKPPHWGGFRIIPDWFEFWQNGKYRLHDRLIFTLRKNTWIIERLAP